MTKLLVLALLLPWTTMVVLAQKLPPKKPANKPGAAKSNVADLSFHDIHVAPDDTVILSGRYHSSGFILKNVDGRISIINVDGSTSVEKVFFLNSRQGWIVHDRGLFQTRDGGTTWEKRSGIVPENSGQIYFLDEYTGWAVNDRKVLVRIVNDEPEPLDNESTGVELREMQFVSNQSGWALKYDDISLPALVRTTDGGTHWSPVAATKGYTVYRFQFLNELEGWVNLDGQLYFTSDSGLSLRFVESPQGPNVFRMSFINRNVGWTVGSVADKVCRTVNRGENWSCAVVETEGYLIDIAFVNEKDGWLVTNANLYRTINGGITWRKVTEDVRTLLKSKSRRKEERRGHL